MFFFFPKTDARHFQSADQLRVHSSPTFNDIFQDKSRASDRNILASFP